MRANRRRVWILAGLLALGFPVADVAADPIILRNGSFFEGDGWVWSQGSTAGTADYTSWNHGIVFPTSGTASASGGLTMTAAGATLVPSSWLTTSISGPSIAARGGAHASAAIQGPFENSFFQLRASSTLVVEFTLATWQAFTFAGRYSGSGDGADNLSWSYGTLYRLVPTENSSSSFTYFRDDFSSDGATTHSGLLEPGRYFLQARSGLLVQGPGLAAGGFDVALGLTPAPATIPEPGTVFLLAGGLASVLPRRRGRTRRRMART